MTGNTGNKDVFNVECIACGSVFNPPAQSPLWWRAKKRGEEGFLDALHVTGEECGCEPQSVKPEASFRVFGYDALCEDFDMPFKTFVGAAREFLRLNRDGGYVVFIDGVSDSVRQRLALL